MEAFEAIVAQRPDDPEGPKMLAKLYHQLDQPERAVAVLEAYIRDFPLATDLTHVNILCELYMEVHITTHAASYALHQACRTLLLEAPLSLHEPFLL